MDERLWQPTAGWKHRALKLWGATEAPSPSAPRGFGICPDLGGSWAEALGLLGRARWYRGAPVALWDPNAAREPWQQQQQLLGSRRCCCAGLLEGLGCSWCAPNQSWLKRVLKEINQRFRVASYQIDWNGCFVFVFFLLFQKMLGLFPTTGFKRQHFVSSGFILLCIFLWGMKRERKTRIHPDLQMSRIWNELLPREVRGRHFL